jgi:DNA repair protein RadD
MDMKDGTREGWLCPIKPANVKVSIDLSILRKRGRIEQDKVDMMLQHLKPLHEIAAGLQRFGRNKPTILFMPGLRSAELITEMFNSKDYGERAALVHGGIVGRERRRIEDAYKAGDIDRLVNIGVYTEGFDAPITQIVGIAAITRSMLRYTQMAGRLTRTYPEGVIDKCLSVSERLDAISRSSKPYGLLLDFKGNLGSVNGFKPPRDAIDLLGCIYEKESSSCGLSPSDIRAIAEDRKSEGLTLEELMQRAG